MGGEHLGGDEREETVIRMDCMSCFMRLFVVFVCLFVLSQLPAPWVTPCSRTPVGYPHSPFSSRSFLTSRSPIQIAQTRVQSCRISCWGLCSLAAPTPRGPRRPLWQRHLLPCSEPSQRRTTSSTSLFLRIRSQNLETSSSLGRSVATPCNPLPTVCSLKDQKGQQRPRNKTSTQKRGQISASRFNNYNHSKPRCWDSSVKTQSVGTRIICLH